MESKIYNNICSINKIDESKETTYIKIKERSKRIRDLKYEKHRKKYI